MWHPLQMGFGVRATLLSISLTFVGLLSLDVSAEFVLLNPSKDNTIIQWSPGTPAPNSLLSNGLGDIFVGRTNQDGQEPATISIRRGLIQFDIAGNVPAGAQITAASLSMRDVRGLNGDPTVRLHRVHQDWGEGTSFFQGGQGAPATSGDVTWLHTFYNVAEPAASATWDNEGGDFAESSSAESVVFDDLGEGQLFTWTSPTLAEDVQSWLDYPDGNFGWIVIGDEMRGQSAKRLNSRESTDLPNTPPTLTIEYQPVFAGDYNNDGRVDAADYVLWRKHLDEFTMLANETATPGRVTAEDYDIWRTHFGAVEMQPDGMSLLPEPHTLTTAVCGALSLFGFARRGAGTGRRVTPR
jgi:hypothetical protein